MKKSMIIPAVLAAFLAVSPITAPESIFPTVSITAEAASKLPAPENFKVSATANSITLSWDKVSGADGYKVMMYDSTTEQYEKYKNVSGTSCTIKELKKSTKYYFKVAALDKVNGKLTAQTFSGKITASTKANTLPKAPSENYTGFATKDGKKYYFTNGKIAQGFKKVNDNYYYFTENGMLTGWLKYYGKYYYFDKNGIMAANKTLKFGDTTYKFLGTGIVEWSSDLKEPSPSFTVNGEKPSFSVILSDDTKYDKALYLLLITNNGSKDLKIYQFAKAYDSDYSEYDRELYMIDEAPLRDHGKTVISDTPLTIKPGKSEFAVFICDDPTWYDEKTGIGFCFKYDNTSYAGMASSKYGTIYDETHTELSKFDDLSSLFD